MHICQKTLSASLKPLLMHPSVWCPLHVLLRASIIPFVLLCAIANAAPSDAHGLHAAPTEISVRGTTKPSTSQKSVVPLKRAPVLLPIVDQKDILPRHRLLADSTLRALPSLCRDTLKEFYVDYTSPESRGLAGEHIMIIAGVDPKTGKEIGDKEFQALIVHECGHIIDLGSERGTVAGGGTEFSDGQKPIFADDHSVDFYRISWTDSKTKRNGARAGQFVSGYALSDPFEDFAETFSYFVLQHNDFQRLAAKNPVLRAKYDFMATLLTGQPVIATGTYVRNTKEPWDVTKLPYEWIPTVEKQKQLASTK